MRRAILLLVACLGFALLLFGLETPLLGGAGSVIGALLLVGSVVVWVWQDRRRHGSLYGVIIPPHSGRPGGGR